MNNNSHGVGNGKDVEQHNNGGLVEDAWSHHHALPTNPNNNHVLKQQQQQPNAASFSDQETLHNMSLHHPSAHQQFDFTSQHRPTHHHHMPSTVQHHHMQQHQHPLHSLPSQHQMMTMSPLSHSSHNAAMMYNPQAQNSLDSPNQQFSQSHLTFQLQPQYANPNQFNKPHSVVDQRQHVSMPMQTSQPTASPTTASPHSSHNIYMQGMYNIQMPVMQQHPQQFASPQHHPSLSSPVAQNNNSNSLPQKRKINKLACEYCSKLHKKCDGDHPNPCSRCKQKGISCVYVQRRKRGPKTKRVKTSHNYDGESSPASQQTPTPVSPYANPDPVQITDMTNMHRQFTSHDQSDTKMMSPGNLNLLSGMRPMSTPDQSDNKSMGVFSGLNLLGAYDPIQFPQQLSYQASHQRLPQLQDLVQDSGAFSYPPRPAMIQTHKDPINVTSNNEEEIADLGDNTQLQLAGLNQQDNHDLDDQLQQQQSDRQQQPDTQSNDALAQLVRNNDIDAPAYFSTVDEGSNNVNRFKLEEDLSAVESVQQPTKSEETTKENEDPSLY